MSSNIAKNNSLTLQIGHYLLSLLQRKYKLIMKLFKFFLDKFKNDKFALGIFFLGSVLSFLIAHSVEKNHRQKLTEIFEVQVQSILEKMNDKYNSYYKIANDTALFLKAANFNNRTELINKSIVFIDDKSINKMDSSIISVKISEGIDVDEKKALFQSLTDIYQYSVESKPLYANSSSEVSPLWVNIVDTNYHNELTSVGFYTDLRGPIVDQQIRMAIDKKIVTHTIPFKRNFDNLDVFFVIAPVVIENSVPYFVTVAINTHEWAAQLVTSNLWQGIDLKFLNNTSRYGECNFIVNYEHGFDDCNAWKESHLNLSYKQTDARLFSDLILQANEQFTDFFPADVKPINIIVFGMLLSGIVAFFFDLVMGQNDRLNKLVNKKTADINALLTNEQQINNRLEFALKMKDNFLGRMSHELRTPLNGIMGINQIIKAKLDQKNQHLADTSQAAASHLLALVEDLLDAQDIGHDKIKIMNNTVNLNALLRNIEDLIRAARGTDKVKITFILENLPDTVITDERRLKQILINILNNALKFTPSGQISLHAKVIHFDERSSIEFKITDTGIGISKEKFQFIFDEFRQADESDTRPFDGAGLGLFITKDIINKLGGSIDVESVLGLGSTFLVRIPMEIISTAASNLLASDIQGANYLHDKHVVIVDAIGTNLIILKILLEQFGLVVHEFSDPIAAFKYITVHPDVEAVLTDINLPQMRGEELCTSLREFGFDMAIIAVTALANQQEITEIMQYPFNGYITKPIDKYALSKVLLSTIPHEVSQQPLEIDPSMVAKV